MSNDHQYFTISVHEVNTLEAPLAEARGASTKIVMT